MTKLHHIYTITALTLLTALVVSQFMIWNELCGINNQEFSFPTCWDKALWKISSDLHNILRAIEQQ